jgi:hypothetical protein
MGPRAPPPPPQSNYAGEVVLTVSTEGFNAAMDALASRLRTWGELRIAEGLKVRPPPGQPFLIPPSLLPCLFYFLSRAP